MPNYLSSLANTQSAIQGNIRQNELQPYRMRQMDDAHQQNALALVADRAKLDKFNQDNALARVIGGKLSEDDYAGARDEAAQGGNIALFGKVSEMMRDQSEADRQQFKNVLDTAAILRATKADDESFGRVLRNMGADDEDVTELSAIPAEALRGMAMGAKDFLKRQQDKGFTLSAGQTRFGPGGKPIASVAPKPDDSEQWEMLPPAEIKGLGFAPGTILQRNTATGQLRPLQKPSTSQVVRDSRGNITRGAQNDIRRITARLYGGTWDPKSQEFIILNRSEREDAIKVARRAVEILQGSDETNLDAAVLKALNEPGMPKPPGESIPDTENENPGLLERAGNFVFGSGEQDIPSTVGLTRDQVVKGKRYRLPDGRTAEWDGTQFMPLEE